MLIERQLMQIKQRWVVIELPEAFLNQWVEVIALTIEPDVPKPLNRRQPHPAIAGKGRTLGDLIHPIVDEAEWECLQ